MRFADLDAPPPEFVRLLAHPVRWGLLLALAEGDFRVRELATRVDEPQNLVSYHLRMLRGGGLVTAKRSSFDGRDSYYHLDLGRCAAALAGAGAALHPALRLDPTPRSDARVGASSSQPSVLFVCTGNSARSPIAEALLRHRAPGRVHVTSAGTRPGPRLHPDAIRVLDEEFGIDVSGQVPRHLDTVTSRRFDRVITLCDKARESRGELLDQPRRIHWSIVDPATATGDDEARYTFFRDLTADLDTRIRHHLPVLTSTDH